MIERRQAAQWLDGARLLRKRARREALPLWPTLLIFGAIICGAVPLYVLASQGSTSSTLSFSQPGPFSSFGGSQPAWYVGMYWMLAIPLGFGLAGVSFRSHTARVGLRDRSLPYIVTGLALFGIVFFSFSFAGPGNLMIRGLLPLLVVSLALGSLSIIARSSTLGIFAIGFIVLTLGANLYNMENIAFRLGWQPATNWEWTLSSHLGLAACGIVLLAASVVSFAWTRRSLGTSR